MPKTAARQSIANLIAGTLTIGEPSVAGPLVVFPLFGPEPRLEYVSYAEGADRGLTVTESVPVLPAVSLACPVTS